MQTLLNELRRAVLRTPDSRHAPSSSHFSPLCLGFPTLTGGVLHTERSPQITLTIPGERGRCVKTSMIIVQRPIFYSFSWLWRSSTVLLPSKIKCTGLTHGSLGSRHIYRRQIKKSLSLSMTTFNSQYNLKSLFYPQSLRLVMVCHFWQIIIKFPPKTFKFVTEAASDSGYQGRTFWSSWEWEPVHPVPSSLFLEQKKVINLEVLCICSLRLNLRK